MQSSCQVENISNHPRIRHTTFNFHASTFKDINRIFNERNFNEIFSGNIIFLNIPGVPLQQFYNTPSRLS